MIDKPGKIDLHSGVSLPFCRVGKGNHPLISLGQYLRNISLVFCVICELKRKYLNYVRNFHSLLFAS